MHLCKNNFYFFIFYAIVQFSVQRIFAQPSANTIPHLAPIENAKQLIVDGKPFIMLAGELNNSSGSSLDYLEAVWGRLTYFNLNTVLAAVSWEMIEPQEGKFDFTIIDGLIAKAREHHLKLVFLWFGTWKNACSSYAPEWVRKDVKRFIRSESGDGSKLNNISVLSAPACTADAKAFAALMHHIKSTDEKINTVLAMQVQNEPGIRKQGRDMSILANDAFKKEVPAALINFLKKDTANLIPEMKKIWGTTNFKTKGNWTDIFGDEADLVFMAWYTATYIDKVAAAGKSVYPLPMYTNAWQEWDEKNKPGDYPSGGPVAKMIPVWQAAAPHIDILAPDIYGDDFAEVCNKYQRMGNPLFIPETSTKAISSANVFYAIGQGAICFSPFGIDNKKWFAADNPIKESYQLLTNLMPYLQQYQGTNKMMGLLGKKGEAREFALGKYKMLVNYTGNKNTDLPGYGIIIALAYDKFLVAGKGLTVTFFSVINMPKRTEILEAYELVYKNNEWIKQRRLNGDETGEGSDHNIQLQLNEEGASVKTATIFSYQ